MKINLNPPYNLIKQLPYCCVPTCIQMVLSRRGLPPLSPEDIGIDLGLTIPPEEKSNFKKIHSGKMPSAGWGTRINEETYGLNNFFRKNKIHLESKFTSVEEIKSVKNYINENLLKGNDILVCFRYGTLYPGGALFGHGSLIESIEKDTITLVDPHGERKKVNVNDLITSIKVHYKNGQNLGGFWSISNSSTKTL